MYLDPGFRTLSNTALPDFRSKAICQLYFTIVQLHASELSSVWQWIECGMAELTRRHTVVQVCCTALLHYMSSSFKRYSSSTDDQMFQFLVFTLSDCNECDRKDSASRWELATTKLGKTIELGAHISSGYHDFCNISFFFFDLQYMKSYIVAILLKCSWNCFLLDSKSKLT